MYFSSYLVNLIELSCVVLCYSEEDFGFKLNIGNSFNVFKYFGHLSQVTHVISTDSAAVNNDDTVFANITSEETKCDSNSIGDIELLYGKTFNQLLDKYFENFKIEGLKKTRQAFIGQFTQEDIMRSFGIRSDDIDCCFVLLKLTKVHKSVKLGDVKGIPLKVSVVRAIEDLNTSDTSEIRKFVRSYGTHYIDSYVTGNIMYQLFKYKRARFNRLISYIEEGSYEIDAPAAIMHSYFSWFSLQQVGDIKTASGNKNLETWARVHLRDIQYLHTKPSILRLSNCHPALVRHLNNMMDGKALVGLSLKSIKQLFKDKSKADMFAEIVDNEMYLWEENI